jgi:hypothetical protein
MNTTTTTSTLFAPFSSTSIDFESIAEEHDQSFGVLNLCVNEFPITSKPISVSLMIDNSGSMSFKCSDGATQQDHVNFTADKVLRYLQNHGIDASISVSSFDDKIVPVVAPQELTQYNIDTISRKIYKITPDGSTNIYDVLTQESRWKQGQSSTRKRLFFLFTDGHPTAGPSWNTVVLLEKAQEIHPDTTVIAIGCGVNHSAELLKGIANRKRGIYKFIGNIEEVSFACGEVLDEVLNDVVEDCEIEAINGEIWDWKKNDWVSKISVRNIIGKCNKTYHVRSSAPATFRASFTGIAVETGLPFQHTIDDIHENVDVRKHKFRHETLVLLHETNEKYKNNVIHTSPKTVKELKRKLTEFVVRMKAFMDDNDLREDIFMKMLCDDIFVCYNAIGTPHGYMYTSSRQTSQATQGIHTNMCNIVEAPPPPLAPLMRDLNAGNIPMPSLCTRHFTQSISMMNQDDMTDEVEDNMTDKNAIHDFHNPPISRWPGAFRNCTMRPVIIGTDEDLFAALDNSPVQLLPKRTQITEQHLETRPDRCLERVDEDEDKDDDLLPPVMSRHVTMSSYDSPYSNDKTMSVIREVSMGSSHAPSDDDML